MSAKEWFRPTNTNTGPFDSSYIEEFELPLERTKQEINSLSMIISSMPQKPRVLDIAGGFGRIGSELIKHRLAASVVDLDLNIQFLQIARYQVAVLVEGDMRYLGVTDKSFYLALLMFTSFGYFATLEEDLRVLREVKRVLHPGGTFLLDLPNYDRILTNFQPERELFLSDNSKIVYKQELVDNLLIETRTKIFSDTNQVQMLPIRLRVYNQESISNACLQAGFSSVQAFDQDLQVYEPATSSRLWLVCTT